MALPKIGDFLEEAEQTAVRSRPKIHRLPGLLIGAGLAVAALLLRWGLDPWLRESQRLLTLYGAVALSVWVAGWPAATVTSVLGYLLLNYVFTPAGGAPVDDPAAIASVLGSWFSCFLIIVFAEQSRRARQLASERKQEMEEHLRRHERLAAIVESSSDAIVSLDLDWKITSWNRGAELLYGYSAAEVEKQSIDIIIPPDRGLEEKRILQQIRNGVLLEHYETVRRRKDGSLVQIALTISPIRDSSGRIIGASKSGRDISRRKEAEWALQRSETKLRTALDAGKLGAWDWDIAHNRVTWTDRLYEFHGLPPGSFAGTVEAFSALLHPDDRERVATALDKSLLGKTPYQVEFRTIRPDGEVRWLVTAAQLIRNERGEPERMVGVTQDVTERVQAQLALQQSEAWFRRLADTMPQLVWTADPTGRVDYYNQRIRSYAGATQDGNGNWHWEPIIHPDDLATTTATWERAVKTSSSYTRTHRTRMADGSYRWHLSRALPVRNANGTVAKWFGTATDIDDQKRTEEQLEAVVAQRTLKLRETVAELEAFSYSIAHDLRAPLRSMSGYAAILLSDHGARLDAEARDFLQRIEASAERLDRLIQDVLNYSKVVRGDMDLERVDFGALAEEIILSYPHLREPDAAIHLVHPLPAVLGNPAALTQVISNLLGNAVKFVPPGAKPEVRVRSEPAPNGFIRFWFEDNGIGIEPESLDRIFQMFQQLNSADQYEGTGIGLSIVRKAAEKMGGRVGVESTPGQGSRFWVELKAAQNPVPSAG